MIYNARKKIYESPKIVEVLVSEKKNGPFAKNVRHFGYSDDCILFAYMFACFKYDKFIRVSKKFIRGVELIDHHVMSERI